MNKKIIYLEILRLIACFFVIVNHTHGLLLTNNSLINTIIYCIDFSLCKIAVPIFFMITGILILEKNYDYKKVFNCIFKIVIPILVISLVMYIINYDNFNLIVFFKSLLEEPYIFSYWYLYALIGLYICIPFIQKLVRNFNSKDYLLFIVLFLIVPAFIDIITLYFNINFNNNLLLSFFPFIICFPICGMYLSKVSLNKRYFKLSLLLFFISYIGMISSMLVPYLLDGSVSYNLDSWNSLPVILMSISIMYIFRYLYEDFIFSKREKNFILTLSSTTFGIYLIHTFLIYKLFNFVLIEKIYIFNEIIGVVVLEVLIFVLCFIIVYILKKIPIIKNFL